MAGGPKLEATELLNSSTTTNMTWDLQIQSYLAELYGYAEGDNEFKTSILGIQSDGNGAIYVCGNARYQSGIHQWERIDLGSYLFKITQDGKLEWINTYPATPSSNDPLSVSAGGMIALSTQDGTYALDPKGKIARTLPKSLISTVDDSGNIAYIKEEGPSIYDARTLHFVSPLNQHGEGEYSYLLETYSRPADIAFYGNKIIIAGGVSVPGGRNSGHLWFYNSGGLVQKLDLDANTGLTTSGVYRIALASDGSIYAVGETGGFGIIRNDAAFFPGRLSSISSSSSMLQGVR